MMEMTYILAVPQTLPAPVAVLHESGFLLWIALALAITTLLMLIRSRRRRQAMQRMATENQIALASIAESVGGMEKQMARIDCTLQKLIQRVDQMQMAEKNNAEFQKALYLVRDGASAKQLVETCGLTRGEAELFQRLHA